LCSGQSNMEFPMSGVVDSDLEVSAARHPQIRFVRIKEPASQVPLENFVGEWKMCSPESTKDFSAVGYFFGRELQDQLGVPIGLVDDSWGGSACEAWIRRDRLERDPLYTDLIEAWDNRVKDWADAELTADGAERRKRTGAA